MTKETQLNPKTDAFMKVADQFQLGDLVTEQPHSGTIGLKSTVHTDLVSAIKKFRAVDLEMLSILESKSSKIFELSQAVQRTLSQGGRIFLSGCGATGRLSLVLENIWRQSQANRDAVVGFMAGGDLALIHSIEKFEDYPDYGARQLRDLGFSSNDLLIASSEGGETPWVIGSALEAAKIGGSAFFLYCNPDNILIEKLLRCQEIFAEDRVSKLNLTASSQALTGSTRLQASSILTAAIGAALFCESDELKIEAYLKSLSLAFRSVELSKMSTLIEKEASIYKGGSTGSLYYEPTANIAMSVLTDTTERSPTFSLSGFDNKFDTHSAKSWCYLLFPSSKNSENAWESLLLRAPRTLEWSDVKEQAGNERLIGFDFSSEVLEWRNTPKPEIFKICLKGESLRLTLEDTQVDFQLPGDDLLSANLILKMILNMHSTLLMGLMNRYESNIMTYVRPSNNKLIDRCVRYASLLLEQRGVECSYRDLVNDCLNFMDEGNHDEPIVLRIVNKYAS